MKDWMLILGAFLMGVALAYPVKYALVLCIGAVVWLVTA